MIFETIYAYIQNIQFCSMALSMMLSVILMILGIIRIKNDLDKDDWLLVMAVVVPLWILFSFLSLAPSLEHIKQVHAELIQMEKPVDNSP